MGVVEALEDLLVAGFGIARLGERLSRWRNSRERELRFAELKLSTEYVPIASVQAYARRLRKPAKSQHQALQDSIRAFGLVLPFLVDRTNVLIGGHALFEAAQALELETIPMVKDPWKEINKKN